MQRAIVRGRYAKLVDNMPARANGVDVMLLDGHDISHVRLGAPGTGVGVYTFRARANSKSPWVECTTDEDLPAYTDRGRAQRRHFPFGHIGTMSRGRPRITTDGALSQIGVRLSDTQEDWLKKACRREGYGTISEYIRATLVSIGMPE